LRKSAMKIERALHYVDGERAAGRPREADDVEAAGGVRQAPLTHIGRRHPAQAMPFLPGDRLERVAEIATRAGPDFHEHEHGAVAGDDVQLAASRAKPPIENRVAPPPQLLAR